MRRLGDLRLVWHGADSAQALGRLSVGYGPACFIYIDTGEHLIIGLARCECAIDGTITGRSVVVASDSVEDMFAVMPVVLIGWVAGFKAEHVGAHEIVPLHDLGPLGTITATESLRVHQSSEWISSSVSAVWVHFTT